MKFLSFSDTACFPEKAGVQCRRNERQIGMEVLDDETKKKNLGISLKNNGCLDIGRSDHFYRVCGDAFGYSFCRYNGTDRSGIV